MTMAALCTGAAACAEPTGSDDEGVSEPLPEEASGGDVAQGRASAVINGVQVTPDTTEEHMAVEAIEATQLVQILSAISGPLAVPPSGLDLEGITSQVIDNMKQSFGSSCVTVDQAPGVGPLDRAVTFTYTACTGPFQQVTIDGTSTTSFELDVAAQQVKVTTVDDLVISADGQQTPVKSTRTGTLTTSGLALTSQIDFVDFGGESRSITGTLDLTPDLEAGCVDASMSGSELNGLASLEITDLSVCMDGNVCVGAVTFEALEGAVALTFNQGQVDIHFASPSLPQAIDASLPVSIPSCVNVGALAGVP
jgi:hypothetical protein